MRVAVVGVIFAIGCAQVWGIDKTTSCPPGQIDCDGMCVDTSTSVDHCGTCGNDCAGDQVCGNGTCAAACPIDQLKCDGTCADPLTDAANCGGCGRACAMGDICSFGECEPPCDPAQLMASVTDPWGIKWDGLERTAGALDAALVTCKAFGARLPTATELYRVAANQTGAVGMSFHTNFLWSQTAIDQTDQVTLRLSDGTTSNTLATVATPYRCVCPAPLAKTFSGNHCNGDPGNACFEINGYHVDTKDRPAVRKSAALRECLADRARLVDTPLLAAAISAGLPGTNTFVATADQASYLGSTRLRWMAAPWDPNTNVDTVDGRSMSPFRCAAPKIAHSPNPNPITNAFVPTGGKFTGEMNDNATLAWAAAHDACFARGGHLPRAAELAELVMSGMPNGSGAQLWTSDQNGFNGTQFLATTLRWVGLDTRYSYVYLGNANQTQTWDYKTGSFPFRCIWYPIDPAYVPPESCEGGCFEVTLPGATSAKMWFDSTDRAASTMGPAFDTCRMAGGYLASERDLTEAIRAGLPNGTAAMTPPWVWTSDFGQNNASVIRWTNTETAFTDQYATYASWAGLTNVYRYRCMWTNELR
jgi:hypothetical protein